MLTITIETTDITTTFTQGETKRVLTSPDAGIATVTGHIKAADGTIYDALLEIGEHDSGELYGAGVWTTDGTSFTFLDEPNWETTLNTTHTNMHPFTYKYTAPPHCTDHHIGPNGWSI